MSSKKKIAIILAAHGEAETPGFMENYRVTRQTLAHASLVMPIPGTLQRVIAISSSLKKRFRRDAEGSPHNRVTREQVGALQRYLNESLAAEQFDFGVYAAFAASPPYVERIIDRTRSSDAQVIVSMAPIDNTMSCGMLCSYLASSRTQNELGNVRVLSRFWSDERLYPVYCDHLFEKSGLFASERNEERILLLLFHGTLVADEKGEPPRFRTGQEESMMFAQRLRHEILKDSRNPYGRVMTAFLNHNVGGEWTKPSFEEIALQLRAESSASVALFGCGYFADGNETIRRSEELVQSRSVREATTIPCLNSAPAFTAYLASKVIDAARQIMSCK